MSDLWRATAGREVRIELASGLVYAARGIRLSNGSLVWTARTGGRSAQEIQFSSPISDVTRVSVLRRGRGAIVGGLAGSMIGGTAGSLANDSWVSSGASIAAGALLGGGAGVLLGGIKGHWTDYEFADASPSGE